MNGFFEKVKYSMQRFMLGRYGGDTLNTWLFVIAVVLDLIGMVINRSVLILLSEALLIYSIFRMFSRNVGRRSLENEWFLSKTVLIRRGWKVFYRNVTDHAHHYFLCPKCHQIVRIPRGHGKVEIHCPKCGEYFTKKS